MHSELSSSSAQLLTDFPFSTTSETLSTTTTCPTFSTAAEFSGGQGMCIAFTLWALQPVQSVRSSRSSTSKVMSTGSLLCICHIAKRVCGCFSPSPSPSSCPLLDWPNVSKYLKNAFLNISCNSFVNSEKFLGLRDFSFWEIVKVKY